MSDWIGVVVAITYIFGLIGLAELMRHKKGLSSDFTRKVVHIGVGMLSWTLPFLFSEPWLFLLGCLAFSIITLLDWHYGFFAAMASSSRSNLGTVYFPLVAGVVVYHFWDYPPLMVGALMPLTWGDGLAPVIGRKYGRHQYQVRQTTRSLEGSLGFFIAAFVATWLALWLMPGQPDLSRAQAIAPALVVSLATMLVEAISIWGLDNITVTLTALFILNAWPF
ncbi:MAG: hypothetical protein R3293_03040 [Candidatus Promineifilaceae bacterium]|nr:hypothetical protein [Candidatus Promineifilaceae bacterium]